MAITRRTGDTPAAQRRAQIRSCAEVLRLLASRPGLDAEGKDMVAFLVFNLRGIYRNIDESANAWDDRNYWKKAEGLRDKWRWSRLAADSLEEMILEDRWHEIPDFLISIIPHFSGVTVSTVTRNDEWWAGALQALKRRSHDGSM